MTVRLHRTHFPKKTIYNGTPLFAYWFEYAMRPWGVSKAQWEHGPQWEVVDPDTMGIVRDDFDTLQQLRQEAPEECDLWLRDQASEEDR